MFTGLVQSMGTVTAIADDGVGGRRLTVREPAMAPKLVLGESIAVDGACLTVLSFDADSFVFQAGPETLAKTSLGERTVGDRVNLERALRVGDALGGHYVTGHVDAVGYLVERLVTGEWQTLWFSCPPEFDDLMVEKGSIAIDGVSLTLVNVEAGRFSVMLIPHTQTHTTLGPKAIGAAVNLETDLLAKHVQKLFKNLSVKI